MKFLSSLEAREFAEKWLPAWTGNNPELLASFYSQDAFYVDPGIPGGVRRKEELLSYFRRLLSCNPNCVWWQVEGIPLEDGFLNKWLARIPVGSALLEIVGVCLVQLKEIWRFDAGRPSRAAAYGDRLLFFGTHKGWLYALNGSKH